MKTILGEIEEVKNTKKTFSRLSFFNSIISLGLIGMVSRTMLKVFQGDLRFAYPNEAILVMHFFFVSGILMTILSIAKKEPSNWMKWVGAILNIVFFVIVYSSIIYAKIIDANR